jgi:acyl transferase domain-containing protein
MFMLCKPDSVPARCDNIPRVETDKWQLYSRGAHFLRGDPAVFDAPFFSITKSDAESMDPQQRKMMEVSFHALENGTTSTMAYTFSTSYSCRLTLIAGIALEKAAGSDTAVYASTMANDFERIQAKGTFRANTSTIS